MQQQIGKELDPLSVEHRVRARARRQRWDVAGRTSDCGKDAFTFPRGLAHMASSDRCKEAHERCEVVYASPTGMSVRSILRIRKRIALPHLALRDSEG